MFHKDESSNQKWWTKWPRELKQPRRKQLGDVQKTIQQTKRKKRLVLWAKQQAPVVEKVDNVIHLINLHSVVNAIGYRSTSLAS